MTMLGKVKDSTLDIDSKAENLEENYGEAEKTFDQEVLEYKPRLSWAKDVFKF